MGVERRGPEPECVSYNEVCAWRSVIRMAMLDSQQGQASARLRFSAGPIAMPLWQLRSFEEAKVCWRFNQWPLLRTRLGCQAKVGAVLNDSIAGLPIYGERWETVCAWKG